MSDENQNLLTDIERGEESCVLRFADKKSFKLDYLKVRLACPCAACKPRQENQQLILDFNESLMRMQMTKPIVGLIGRYAIRFEWPSGCSSGLYSFKLLRKICNAGGLNVPEKQ
tara:strand:+ start:205 stop:546 length:342 start_codon:yes stop_codon:yes gene_type:complete